jgi:hypothetical protein
MFISIYETQNTCRNRNKNQNATCFFIPVNNKFLLSHSFFYYYKKKKYLIFIYEDREENTINVSEYAYMLLFKINTISVSIL